MTGNAQIVEGIKRDRSGIGFVGAGYILQDDTSQPVKVLKIRGLIGGLRVWLMPTCLV
jgi:phosphate transport system substrate-binding protein